MKHFTPPTGRRTRQAVLLSALLAASAGAQAVQTKSGTDITNRASLEYSVGGVGQTGIPSNIVSFKVDKKVDVNVAATDATYVSVAPGANAIPGTYATALKVLTFNVTNEGNDAQSIHLAASETGVTDPFGGTDNFDSTPFSCTTYVDDGVDGFDSKDVNTDTIASLGSDATAKVYVVCSIPGDRAHNDIAAIALTATVGEDGGGSAYAAADEDLNEDVASVQIVFADGDGPYDSNRDAAHSDESAYKVATTTLTVTKDATTICDPANGTTNPKAIPGAYVQYEIHITNTGTIPAALTTLTDTLQATNTAIDPDLKTADSSCATAAADPLTGSGFRISCTGLRACATTPTYFTTTSDADGIDHDGSATGGTVTVNFDTALAAETGYANGELKTGESVTVRFNVIIQ